MIEIVDGWTEWAGSRVDVKVTRIAWIDDTARVSLGRPATAAVAEAFSLHVRAHPYHARSGLRFSPGVSYALVLSGGPPEWVRERDGRAEAIADLLADGSIEIAPDQVALLEMREYSMFEAMVARYLELLRVGALS